MRKIIIAYTSCFIILANINELDLLHHENLFTCCHISIPAHYHFKKSFAHLHIFSFAH